jgi:hypothetical protein
LSLSSIMPPTTMPVSTRSGGCYTRIDRKSTRSCRRYRPNRRQCRRRSQDRDRWNRGLICRPVIT